jgi:hypothetical protein
MPEFSFADEMKRACRHCATFARAKLKTFGPNGEWTWRLPNQPKRWDRD